MLYRFLFLPVFAGICFICPNLRGQSALTSFGGDVSSQSGSISFSAGQIAYTYHSNSDFELGQGIQQAFAFEILHFDQLADELVLNAYPNPTRDALVISVSDHFLGANLKVFSAEGRYIRSIVLNALVETISLDKLQPGTYFIHLTATGKASVPQVLKVIKT